MKVTYLGNGRLDVNSRAVDIVRRGYHGVVHRRLVGEGDETKALGGIGARIAHDDEIDDVPEIGEVVAEGFLLRQRVKPADKQPLSLVFFIG